MQAPSGISNTNANATRLLAIELCRQWTKHEEAKEFRGRQMSDLLQEHLVGAFMQGIGAHLLERQIDAKASAALLTD